MYMLTFCSVEHKVVFLQRFPNLSVTDIPTRKSTFSVTIFHIVLTSFLCEYARLQTLAAA